MRASPSRPLRTLGAGPGGASLLVLVTLGFALGIGGCGFIFQERGEPGPSVVSPDGPSEAAGELPPGEPPPAGTPAEEDVEPEEAVETSRGGWTTDLPGGFGTLRQERISMDLRRGELRMRITPLAESVIRTTAPDTWERLSALAATHRQILRERTGADSDVQLFLVAVHSETETIPFEPSALTLVSRGVRHRPLEVRGLTPGWELQRVGARETQLGVYAFPSVVDLEGELEVEYQDVRSREWERVLAEVQAERMRIRARAGG